MNRSHRPSEEKTRLKHTAYNISEVTTLAKRFSDSGDWLNASLMNRMILEEFSDLSDGEYHDEEGELAQDRYLE